MKAYNPLRSGDEPQASSFAIAWMIARGPLVATLVVASEPRHELLSVIRTARGGLIQELLGVVVPKRCRQSTVMQHFNRAVFSFAPCETVGSGGYVIHGLIKENGIGARKLNQPTSATQQLAVQFLLPCHPVRWHSLCQQRERQPSFVSSLA